MVSNLGAQYLLQDIPVLAIGTQTPTAAPGSTSTTGSGAGLITFEVTPQQALQVVSANQSGSLYLTLHALSADSGAASVTASGG